MAFVDVPEGALCVGHLVGRDMGQIDKGVYLASLRVSHGISQFFALNAVLVLREYVLLPVQVPGGGEERPQVNLDLDSSLFLTFLRVPGAPDLEGRDGDEEHVRDGRLAFAVPALEMVGEVVARLDLGFELLEREAQARLGDTGPGLAFLALGRLKLEGGPQLGRVLLRAPRVDQFDGLDAKVIAGFRFERRFPKRMGRDIDLGVLQFEGRRAVTEGAHIGRARALCLLVVYVEDLVGVGGVLLDFEGGGRGGPVANADGQFLLLAVVPGEFPLRERPVRQDADRHLRANGGRHVAIRKRLDSVAELQVAGEMRGYLDAFEHEGVVHGDVVGPGAIVAAADVELQVLIHVREDDAIGVELLDLLHGDEAPVLRVFVHDRAEQEDDGRFRGPGQANFQIKSAAAKDTRVLAGQREFERGLHQFLVLTQSLVLCGGFPGPEEPARVVPHGRGKCDAQHDVAGQHYARRDAVFAEAREVDRRPQIESLRARRGRRDNRVDDLRLLGWKCLFRPELRGRHERALELGAVLLHVEGDLFVRYLAENHREDVPGKQIQDDAESDQEEPGPHRGERLVERIREQRDGEDPGRLEDDNGQARERCRPSPGAPDEGQLLGDF